MTDTKKGWELLHSKLPQAALKEVPESVYKVKGLSDVNEGYLFARLFAADLGYEWKILEQSYLGCEDRTSRSGNINRWYMAAVHGVLVVDGREFHGSGAHDNMKLDAAFKGAATVAFKNATKVAGMWNELLMNGRAMDFIYATKDGDVVAPTGSAPADPPATTATGSSTPAATGSASQTPDADATSSSSGPSRADSSSSAEPPSAPAEPKPELTPRQAGAIKYLLDNLPDEHRDHAKQRAWAKMKAAAVRDPKASFRAGAEDLILLHEQTEGVDPKHAELVKGQIDKLEAEAAGQKAA